LTTVSFVSLLIDLVTDGVQLIVTNKSIESSRHNWCIRVRVARMWTVSGTSKGRSFSGMELVLVDEEVRHFTYASNIFSLVVAM